MGARDLFGRIKSAYWSFANSSDCCECVPGLENMLDDYIQEIEDLTKELKRVNLENENLKRELEFYEK